MRIVSLLPSATEILFAVGAGDDVVGVTFECDHPAEARTRRVVSNTALPSGLSPKEIDAEVSARLTAGEDLYRLDEGALAEIEPDLVVTQDLCAVCAVDVGDVNGALDYLGCQARVLTLDPSSLDEVVDSVLLVGTTTGHERAAEDLHAALRRRLRGVGDRIEDRLDGAGERPRPRLAVLEWTDPPFCAGHWIPDMVTAAGADCVLGRPGTPSERIRWQEVSDAAPDVVVVAPCGYHLEAAAALARDLDRTGCLPAGAALWAVDADAAFVRPGPRVVDGVEALAAIAHPDVIGATAPLQQQIGR